MNDENTPATKADLREFAEQIVSQLRDEFDSKLEATKNELKAHTEEVVGNHAAEVLDQISEVVVPLRAQVNRHEREIKELQRQVAV